MISLYDVLEASNGQLFGEAGAQLFSDFCLDAAKAQDANLFVAIKGDFGDTHQNMQEAVQNGAAGILCTSPPTFDTEGVTVIVVKDTETALTDWARFVLAQFRVRTILVTGTGERETTVAAIAGVLSAAYKTLAVYWNPAHGRLSLPMSLSRLEQGHDFVVLEVVANQPGEVLRQVKLMKPHAAVVCSIGPAYLDCFESLDEIQAEHLPALQGLLSDGVAVLNYNDDRVRAMATETTATVLTVSVDAFGADVIAHNIVPGPTRTGFDLRFAGHGERYVGRWAPTMGESQLYAALFALALGTHFGITVERVLRALTEFEPPPGHMRPYIGLNNCLVIDNSDDATPETMLAALDWLKQMAADGLRPTVVIGDVDHLGASSRLMHRRVGQKAAAVAHRIVTEGGQAALAGRAAMDVAEQDIDVHITYSSKDAIAALRTDHELSAEDVLLVMGGANARMELIVEALLANADDAAKLPRRGFGAAEVLTTNRPMQPSWVEIDRETLAENIQRIKAHIGPDVALMATVKADAYGHGAVAVSRVAVQNGADYLAVANIQEALDLRDAGIMAPILVLSYTPIYAIREAVRNDITVTVYDLDLARAFNTAAKEANQKLKIHVKVDSGMGRLGILPDDTISLFRHLIAMPYLDIEGIYTHFSTADEDEAFAQQQLSKFKETMFPIRAGGVQFKYIHASNSAGLLLGEAYHFNLVRAGLMLYGSHPSRIAEPIPGVRPLLTWKTVVAQVKTLPPGHAIGYGNTYTTSDHETVAVIPVGYADGFRRAPQNWGEVLIHGQRAPIRGRVSMEKTVVSVDHIKGVSIGDEVVLLGRQGDAEITADEIAERLGTISYEVYTSVLPRIPR